MLLAQRRSGESEPGVEPRCFFIDGVGQYRPDAGLLGHQRRAADCILQQAEADAPPLIVLRYRQPRQDHHRQRVPPHPLADALRRFQRFDLAHGQAEVARHAAIVLGNDEGLGRAAALRLTRVAQEPVVERGLAAVEAFQPMLFGQRLRRAQRHFSSQGALRANRSAKPALGCSGRSSRSMKAWYRLPETANRR